jgi:hypothetical protein
MAGIAAFPVPVHHILIWRIAVNIRVIDTTSKKVLEMLSWS